jgi:phosphoserine aminotransferase
MNLLKGKTTCSYLNTGYWSKRAINEAKILCPNIHYPTEVQKNEKGEMYVPPMSEWTTDKNSAYLHYCDNETVEGLEYGFLPKVENLPLISDMSSNFLTRAVDWSRMDCIYAHAQKNIGISGSAIVIIRESLIDK